MQNPFKLLFVFIGLAVIASYGQDSPEALSLADQESSREYACSQVPADSINLLKALLDPYTGLPYDEIPCNDRTRWGVFPQHRPGTDIRTFSQAPTDTNAMARFQFVDEMPDESSPTLFWALRLDLVFTSANTFGGVKWDTRVDISRYDRLFFRYRVGPRS